MESEDKCGGVNYNRESRPKDPDVCEKLTPEQKKKMEQLFALDTNMTQARALQIVLGTSEEEK